MVLNKAHIILFVSQIVRVKICLFWYMYMWIQSSVLIVFRSHSLALSLSLSPFNALSPRWIEACIEDELPPTTELEQALRNGVILCRLGHYYAPEVLPLKRIYDLDEAKYRVRKPGQSSFVYPYSLAASHCAQCFSLYIKLDCSWYKC